MLNYFRLLQRRVLSERSTLRRVPVVFVEGEKLDSLMFTQWIIYKRNYFTRHTYINAASRANSGYKPETEPSSFACRTDCRHFQNGQALLRTPALFSKEV